MAIRADIGSYDEAAAGPGLRKEATKKILEAANYLFNYTYRNECCKHIVLGRIGGNQ